MFPLSILYSFGEKNETNWQILGIISIKAAIFFYIGYFLFIWFLCDCVWTNSQDLKILDTLSTHWFSRVDTILVFFAFILATSFLLHEMTGIASALICFDLLDTKTFYNFVDQDDNAQQRYILALFYRTITVEVRFV